MNIESTVNKQNKPFDWKQKSETEVTDQTRRILISMEDILPPPQGSDQQLFDIQRRCAVETSAQVLLLVQKDQ